MAILIPSSTFLTTPGSNTTFTVDVGNGASVTVCTVELSAGILRPGACDDNRSEVLVQDDHIRLMYGHNPKTVQVRILDGSMTLDEGTFAVNYSGDRCCRSGEVAL